MIIEEIDDYERILELKDFFKSILLEPYGHFTFAEMFVMSRRYMLVALSENKVVGSVIGKHEKDGCGYIAMLAVKENYRKQGIGRSLIKNCLMRMYMDGMCFVYLETDIYNHAAIELYQSFGFQKVMFLERYYLDLSPAYRLELILDKENLGNML